jgi:hypothetical protein
MANPRQKRENTEQRMQRLSRQLTDSTEQFNRFLKDSIDLVGQAGQQFHRQIHMDLLAGIVKDTPVDTGRARGNWQSSVGGQKTGTIDRTSGEEAVQEGAQETQRIRLGDTSFIQNNLEYIGFLEDGSSTQAPQGMVSVNLQRLREIRQ